MKIKYLLVLLLGSMPALMLGCGKNTVYSVHDQILVVNASKYSEDDVKKAMITAGANLGWIMHADKPGHILGTLNKRKHMAQVDINYDLKNYSITYYNSTNLNYVAAGSELTDDGGTPYSTEEATIHRSYNNWVKTLDVMIKAQLSTIY